MCFIFDAEVRKPNIRVFLFKSATQKFDPE